MAEAAAEVEVVLCRAAEPRPEEPHTAVGEEAPRGLGRRPGEEYLFQEPGPMVEGTRTPAEVSSQLGNRGHRQVL